MTTKNSYVEQPSTALKEKSDFEPLILREVLNKIAPANSSRERFFASTTIHDLILSSKKGDRNWVAILSITDLCRIIKSLPDSTTQQD